VVIAVGVGAYLSYAGTYGIDYLAPNVLFAITAAGTAAVAEFQRAELERVMQADKTKTVLLQELAHRTKNNLAVLSAMIRLEARKSLAPSGPIAFQVVCDEVYLSSQQALAVASLRTSSSRMH
jgi:two-component system, sensor histidine kinase PdtaS